METPALDNRNIAPGIHDVILGRGGFTTSHDGNVNFRKLVSEHKQRYLDVSKAEKPKVAREVVQIWRKMDPPGRFLARKDDLKGNISTSTENAITAIWYDVGDKKAREKASQCLRERSRRVPTHVEQFRNEQSGVEEGSEEIKKCSPKAKNATTPNVNQLVEAVPQANGEVGTTEQQPQQEKQMVQMRASDNLTALADLSTGFRFPDPCQQQGKLPPTGFTNCFSNYQIQQKEGQVLRMTNMMSCSHNISATISHLPQVASYGARRTYSRSSSLSSIAYSDLESELDGGVDIDLGSSIDDSIHSRDAVTAENMKLKHCSSKSSQQASKESSTTKKGSEEDFAVLTLDDYRKKLEGWTTAARQYPNFSQQNDKQRYGAANNHYGFHTELTVSEYQQSLDDYLSKNMVMVMNNQEDNLDDGSEYEEDLSFDDGFAADTTIDSISHHQLKYKRRKQRICREPRRGVSRNKSKDSIASMMSLMSIRSSGSAISSISFNTWSSNADVEGNNTNLSNCTISYSREMKAKAVKKCESSRSLMSEATDISHDFDDMTIGEVSQISIGFD